MLRHLPSYDVATILKITAAVALMLATVRLLGPTKSWMLFVTCYAFAPTIAMFVMWRLRRKSARHRYVSAGLTLLCFGSGMILLSGWFYGVQAMAVVVLGTLIEWPGQIAVLFCLRLIGGGGPSIGSQP
jgi:hypothetical protein